LHSLNQEIGQAARYDGEKLQRIQRLKNSFQQPGNHSLPSQYQFYQKLFDEYKTFTFDTAFLYARKLTETAVSLNDPAKIAESNIDLLFTFVSAGMFKEASEVIEEIRLRGLPEDLKATYYSLTARYYYDLADYVNDKFYSPSYTGQGNDHLDSALHYYPAGTFEQVYYRGLRNLKQNSLEEAKTDFQSLLSRHGLTEHQQALVSSTLSYIYLRQGKKQTAIDYQIKAAIADIRSSTKETFAIFNLAQLLFEEGDFDNAAAYIEKAINDASFYGARQRKVQVSTILPIIQSSRINFIESQRKYWIIYSIAVSGILVLLTFLVITIYRQNKRLALAKQTISAAHSRLSVANEKLSHANESLQRVNTELKAVNGKLEEANKIKDEYVGYFFNSSSVFIHKMERMKKSLEEKLINRKIDEMRFLVNKIDIREEKEELLKNFDKAFLKLFPHFVEEINALLREEERITLPDKDILNTDLRIYALLRLGVRENEKIAEILEYSVKSIYAYKTKIRNKAIVSKEEFDKMVMNIRSI
jgi:tetratricopeptide (TPR) repeat protein